jgi:hypothetical protein
LRRSVNLSGRVGEVAAGGTIGFVGESGPNASAALDRHPVTGASEERNDIRNKSDAAFSARDFTRNSDQHPGVAFGWIILGYKISTPWNSRLYSPSNGPRTYLE